MPDKIFLHLLILYGIWSQEITGTFGDVEIKNSSDFVFRQKRVVSHLPGEDVPVKINQSPYLVAIKNHERMHCTGNILSRYVVITSAPCIHSLNPQDYRVIPSTSRSTRGNPQSVTEIRKRFGNHRANSEDGIALLTVNPPFVYSHKCQPIELHSGPILPGVIAKISGFGFNYRCEDRGTIYPVQLRSIEVPIMAHRECVNRYRPRIEISDKEVCTYHPQRHCGHTDGGSGLVIDGELAGVFLWSGIQNSLDRQYPDVYVVLQDVEYNQWIQTNVHNIELQFRNVHH